VFTTEAHPPPSAQYTRVVQGKTKYKVRKYKEGDMVWMWDTQKGEPTNVKGSTRSWLGPFKVGMELVDDSYYLLESIDDSVDYIGCHIILVSIDEWYIYHCNFVKH
jgi:hypothetical protein